MIRKIYSKLDKSINIIIPQKKSFLECRYVRRNAEKVSAYVSSHNGCKMGCKFCYLTQQNQREFKHSKLEDFNTQLKLILECYKNQEPAKRININFMARGEPLANSTIHKNYGGIYKSFKKMTKNAGFSNMKINISTIMPHLTRNISLINIFQEYPVYLYYSLYSLDKDFRRKWIPSAIDPVLALTKLRDYQKYSGLDITIHYALIKGENDDIESAKKIRDLIAKNKIVGKLNLVSYNPHPKLKTEETDKENKKKIFEIVKSGLIDCNNSKIVPKIGYDVNASCGMFYNY